MIQESAPTESARKVVSREELRAQMDTETVKGLQLMSGGTAALLVTMLPVVLQNPGLNPFAGWMIGGIVSAAFGLMAAVIHNRLRRKCSLEYERREIGISSPGYTGRFMRWCATERDEPRVCTRSIIFMWGSFVLFFVALATVGYGASRVVGREIPPLNACWEIKEQDGAIYKFNTCTGEVVPYAYSL